MTDYPKPSLTADALVFTGEGDEMKVLLIRRSNPPFKWEWAFPGGFSDRGEPILRTCVRELEEETGLVIHPSKGIPLSLRAKDGRDPRGWTVSQPVMFYLEEEPPVKGMDDAESAEFVRVSDISKLAFDHGAIFCEALACFWEKMSRAEPRLVGIAGYGEPSEEIPHMLFYGGSFNPWHSGHTACVEQALGLTSCGISTMVVPDTNPFKPGMEQVCFWEHYLDICARVPKGVSVYPGFCGMETPNPTNSWIHRTSWRKKSLILGDDSFLNLHLWFEVERLLKGLCNLYVVPRGATPSEVKQALDRISRMAPDLHIERLAEHPFQHISSTLLRRSKS